MLRQGIWVLQRWLWARKGRYRGQEARSGRKREAPPRPRLVCLTHSTRPAPREVYSSGSRQHCPLQLLKMQVILGETFVLELLTLPGPAVERRGWPGSQRPWRGRVDEGQRCRAGADHARLSQGQMPTAAPASPVPWWEWVHPAREVLCPDPAPDPPCSLPETPQQIPSSPRWEQVRGRTLPSPILPHDLHLLTTPTFGLEAW